jgi:hypothetical protein
MAKFTKKELKQSLIDGLTLVKISDKDDWAWCEFHELKYYLSKRYEIFNDEKRELFNKMR